MKKMAAEKPKESTEKKYISQTDVPAFSLDQAVRVGQAIADNYGKSPTKPLRVAEAMDLSPNSSTFRMICGASIAYGLTDGGYNADVISLTGLGRRIVAPTTEGDDALARREALLKPRVVREFLTRYNESKLPSETIGRNVLNEMGVPQDRAADVFKVVVEGARAVGYLREVKGQLYVDFDKVTEAPEKSATGSDDAEAAEARDIPAGEEKPGDVKLRAVPATSAANNRVFITHGRNKEIVSQIKDLLTFGKFSPIVATEQESVSKPVPDKVLDEMRSCGAAIIHVGAEIRVMDPDGKEIKMLNQNVLIEIGAAMALYGRKFILLVERGVTLPSNLQGLYEVRYEGEKLDYDATMKLLRAFNEFKE